MIALTVIAALVVILIDWTPILQRRRGAKGRVWRGGLLLGLALMFVGTPATAWASPPTEVTFTIHDVFVDSEVCAPEGFSVDVIEDEVQTFRVFSDRTGAVAFVAEYVDYHAVISANGHTIVERDRWKNTFYPDGSARTVGNSVHIQGPGPGLVQHDAGQIVFGADGSVQAIHGPHPQFEGQTFCFALLP